MDSESTVAAAALLPSEDVTAGGDESRRSSNVSLTDKKSTRSLQKLEEKAKKAEEALAAETKVREDLEQLNSKLLSEKTALLESLSGEKNVLQEFQEKTAKLNAQKNDLDNQLRVSDLCAFPRKCVKVCVFVHKSKRSEKLTALWPRAKSNKSQENGHGVYRYTPRHQFVSHRSDSIYS